MSGHKISHTQLERYHIIDSLFASGRTVAFDDLLSFLRNRLRDLRLSESSVRRDIRYMRDELGAPLAYDKVAHGWKYTKPFKFPSEAFSDGEVLALQLMRKLLAQYSPDDALHTMFDSLLEKITPNLHENPQRLTMRQTIPFRYASGFLFPRVQKCRRKSAFLKKCCLRSNIIFCWTLPTTANGSQKKRTGKSAPINLFWTKAACICTGRATNKKTSRACSIFHVCTMSSS